MDKHRGQVKKGKEIRRKGVSQMGIRKKKRRRMRVQD